MLSGVSVRRCRKKLDEVYPFVLNGIVCDDSGNFFNVSGCFGNGGSDLLFHALLQEKSGVLYICAYDYRDFCKYNDRIFLWVMRCEYVGIDYRSDGKVCTCGYGYGIV